MFKFSPAISFFVNCETQEEIDALWAKLSLGGETQQRGWLQDKFGCRGRSRPDSGLAANANSSLTRDLRTHQFALRTRRRSRSTISPSRRRSGRPRGDNA